MRTDLAELNQAISSIDWSPPPDPEIRFYYHPASKKGIRVGGLDDNDPYVLITRAEYDEIDVAYRFYLSATGKIKPIPVEINGGVMLELSDIGPYRTMKDCMLFADPNGPDAYKIKEPDYD